MARALEIGAIVSMVAGLAACSSGGVLSPTAEISPPSAPPVAPSAEFKTLPSDMMIGKWGLASYRDDKDRTRTEKMARAQCSNAYVITKGPTDGVMMHVADDPKPYELELKKGSDGKTYLGFNAPPGDPQDRVVLELTSKEMVMRFVDPDTNDRYGTFVYVRC